MCSYQRINNSYGCANSKTLNGLLKTELGFQVIILHRLFQEDNLTMHRALLFPIGEPSMQE